MTPDQRKAGTVSKEDLFFFALFIVLFLLVFREFFFTNRVFYERDSTVVEVPVRKLTVQLLREGDFALWTDALGNGQPFMANPKNAVFYPTTWLYLFLPLFTAFKLHYLLHALLGWLGLYALCRSYSLSRKASFLGASIFAFSGMHLSSFEFYNHTAAVAWMPWILLLLHRNSPRGGPRFLLLAVLWTLMILAGAPEFILMTLLLAACQSFFEAGRWKREIALCLLSLLLAASISAVQVIPSMELLGRTERKAPAVQWPLELIQLANLPFPHFLGNDREPGHNDFWGWHLFDKKLPLYYSFYMGVGTLLLLFFGLRKPRDRRRKLLFLALFLFFLLSCGRYSPFFALYRFVPLLSSIRYPVKFFLGSVFCMSILAAFGYEDVTDVRGPRRKAAFFLAAGSGLGLLLFLLFGRPVIAALNGLFVIDKEASLRELGRSIGTGLVLLTVYALIVLFLRASKNRARVAAWLLMAAAVLDPAYHNRYVNPTVEASFYDRATLPGGLKPPLAVYRDEFYSPFLKETIGDNLKLLRFFRKTLYPFTALGDGVRYVFNWDFYGTCPRRYLYMRDALKKMPPASQLKILRYVGCAAHIGQEPLFSRDGGQRLQVEGVTVRLERIAEKGASPFVAFRSVKAAGERDKLGIFTRAGFDPYEEVILDGDPDPAEPPSGPALRPGPVTVREETQGRGLYSVDMPRDGIMVLPGNHDPGWRAWIDGKKSAVFEANIFSKAVAVPAGRHEVILRYRPASFSRGAAVSLASVFLALCGWMVFSVRPTRRDRPSSP